MDGYRTQKNAVKNGNYVLVSAGMVLPAAFLFCVVANLPHVFLIACGGFVLSYFIRTPIAYSDRSIIYGTVASLVLVVLLDMVFPMKQDRFYHIGRIFMSNISIPTIIYLAVFATFYESNAYTFGFCAAFSLLTLMFGGDFRMAVSASPEDLFPGLLKPAAFHRFFLITSVVVLVMILVSFNLARKSIFHRPSRGFNWKKKFVYSTALITAAAIAFGMTIAFDAYKSQLLKLEIYLRNLRPNQKRISGVLFDREIDLNTTIRADRKKHAKLIILRVAGTDDPPGYLRGRTYQYYSKGKWQDTTEAADFATSKLNIEDLAMNAFYLDKKSGPGKSEMIIYPSGYCYADYLFLPGNTERVEMVADKLKYSRNGYFLPVTWEKGGGYTAWMKTHNQFAAYSGPEKFTTLQYLPVPSELSQALSGIMADIRAGKSPGTSEINLSDSEIVDSVTSYFQKKFKYTLSPEAPPVGEDPLEFFLTKTKAGHCELFASSAVMLLRKYGIPARYVTGFVCHERHPDGKYYVARLADAHAWTEAYLRDEKKWVLVDTTPPAPETGETQWGFFETWTDRVKYAFQKIMADVRRGYVARAVLEIFTEIFSFLWDMVTHPVGGILLLLSASLILFVRKYRKQLNRAFSLKLKTATAGLQKKFRKLEKRAARRAGIRRQPGETPEEWLERVKLSGRLDEKSFANLAEFIRGYNRVRFSRKAPDESQMYRLNKLYAEM